MWMNKKEQSNWALKQAMEAKENKEDYSEYIDLIVDPFDAYRFCNDVEDIPKIRKLMNESWIISNYLMYDGKAKIGNWEPDKERVLKDVIIQLVNEENTDIQSLMTDYCVATKEIHSEFKDLIHDSCQCVRICEHFNDDIIFRNRIRNDEARYKYCENVKDREEMWSKIKSNKWATLYCSKIKDRPEVRKYITSARSSLEYVQRKKIKNIKEFDQKIYKQIKKSSEACYGYCCSVKDDPELAKCIVANTYKERYFYKKFSNKEITYVFYYDNGETISFTKDGKICG